MKVASFSAPARVETESSDPFRRIVRLTRTFVLATVLTTLAAGALASGAAEQGTIETREAAASTSPDASATGDPAGTGQTMTPTPTSTVAPEAKPESGPAYRVVSTDGGIYNHGWFDSAGSASGASTSPVVGLAQSDDGEGYWVATADGGVFSFGDVEFYGSATDASSAPVTDIESSPSHRGYWLAGADGGAFAFDAQFVGSVAPILLNSPISGIAAL